MKLTIGLSKMAVAVAAISFSVSASADLITNGFTFSVASGSDTSVGSHYHSNTGGSFGNPAGKAEVGRYYSEEVRGLSEYNLSSLGVASSAFVTFDVFKLGGLFSGANDFPFVGNIQVQAYGGNNLENISDYQAASLGTVGNFSTVGLDLDDVLSFDITSLFNAAINAGNTSFGIRLQATPLNSSGAYTFDDFRLTTDNQCTTCSSSVPEPGSLALLGLAIAGLVASRRKMA